jgi:hypothetical protein
MENFTLLGFPRQGTDFFAKCLVHGQRYKREYFNPCVNPDPDVRRWFGCERSPRNIFLRPDEETFAQMFAKWRGQFNMNKENFSFFKSDLFMSRSWVVYLFRDREHTFPSSRPDFILPIFDAFVSSSFNSGTVWHEASRYLSLMNVADEKVKQVLIHEAMWRLQVWSAPCPVLFYSDLMEFSESELTSKLSALIPEWVDVGAAARRIAFVRKWNKTLRENRWRLFVQGSTVEKDLDKFSSFLDSLVGPWKGF